MKTSSTDALTMMTALIAEQGTRDRNEAETRHKILDSILHDFLAWPRNRVKVEEYINPGFADYVLCKENGDHLLFIEAKKEGVFFELPIPHNSKETSCYLSIKKLVSNASIKSAMQQVRTYCFDSGCEFACITNGHEWIFFKAFEKGKRFEDSQAFVIRSLQFFVAEYTRSVNQFSFVAITENASLSSMLASSFSKDRGIFYPKEKIPSYAHTINQNRLASTLRPVANRYFGVIGDDDTDFMERCYVAQREYKNTFDGIHNVIQDSLSPYLENYGVQQLDDTGKGGQLGGRITKLFKRGNQCTVLVLFGGKGAGKSTFIKRLLHHNPPRWLKEHASVAIIDLLKVPEDREVIREAIWNELVRQLDTESILSGERDELIKSLFHERYAVALKQDLSGLKHDSDNFNLKLNDLIRDWKNDKLYCAKCLVDFLTFRQKGVIVVVDNTDQYSSTTQDFCFSSAQEISSKLNCISIISMREERFYDSKIHGVLDAYQNSGFHISSPKPAEVFRKRLDFATSRLSVSERDNFDSGLDSEILRDSKRYMSILKREFSNDTSPLNNFLSACAHGDTRLSLDLFRSFLLSGYTNVDEMILSGHWNFQIHQVLKPVMIPNRYFYDETLSDIPNVFQLRSNRHGSHFTSLRILRKLSRNLEKNNPSYHAIAELRTYFAETFNMIEDFERNVDVLLKRGFVEANNRLDSYSKDVDSVKITNYGLYMIRDLAYYFTYLDLICTDCGIFSEQTCNYLIEAAKKEYGLFNQGERVERVKVRLDRVGIFIEYLAEEEKREREEFSLNMAEHEMFTAKIRANFESEKIRVLRSAKRQPRRQ